MQVTIYLRPHGQREVHDIPNVDPADAAWFEANNVKVSMEEDGTGGAIIYADIGRKDEDGEPDELIEFSRGRDCIETLSALRDQCEKELSCAAGIHSWVGETGKLPADTQCTHCGEPYGDPE